MIQKYCDIEKIEFFSKTYSLNFEFFINFLFSDLNMGSIYITDYDLFYLAPHYSLKDKIFLISKSEKKSEFLFSLSLNFTSDTDSRGEA